MSKCRIIQTVLISTVQSLELNLKKKKSMEKDRMKMEGKGDNY